MAGKRITKAELTTRVEKIVTLILSGLRYSEMWRFVAEKTEWSISQRTLDRYLAKANEAIEAIAEKNEERQLALTQARLLDLYKKATNIQDYKTCLSVLRESNKLNGLYPPEKHELTGKDGGPIEYAGIRERLAGRLAQRDAARGSVEGDGDVDG